MTALAPAGRPGFLASVATLDEMRLALAGGVDIVDLKDPAKGALGAWNGEDLRAAAALWRTLGPGRPALSATVGDQPLVPHLLRDAAEAVAGTGVPLVKIGFFGGAGDRPAVDACLTALAPLAAQTRLIAVLFADRQPDLSALAPFAAAGFAGVMLDTAGKAGGGLRGHLPAHQLAAFVDEARRLGLMTGLAGSLRAADIAPLAALRPDYLGFRGALCHGARTGALDPSALERVSHLLAAARDAAAHHARNAQAEPA